MPTKSDDHPLGQTAEPVACAGTDRNLHDRYFFDGCPPDAGGARMVGVCPPLDVADAHFAPMADDKQIGRHASCSRLHPRHALPMFIGDPYLIGTAGRHPPTLEAPAAAIVR